MITNPRSFHLIYVCLNIAKKYTSDKKVLFVCLYHSSNQVVPTAMYGKPIQIEISY